MEIFDVLSTISSFLFVFSARDGDCVFGMNLPISSASGLVCYVTLMSLFFVVVESCAYR